MASSAKPAEIDPIDTGNAVFDAILKQQRVDIKNLQERVSKLEKITASSVGTF